MINIIIQSKIFENKIMIRKGKKEQAGKKGKKEQAGKKGKKEQAARKGSGIIRLLPKEVWYGSN